MTKSFLFKFVIFSIIKGLIKMVSILAEKKLSREIIPHWLEKRGEDNQEGKMQPENQMFSGEQGQSRDQGSKLGD